MISDKYKLIFVHIPKCGGTSIESLIWKDHERNEKNLWMGFLDKYYNKYQTGGLQHLKALQIRHHIGRKKFNQYFKFSLVRNPYARSVSQFRYMKKREDLRNFIGLNIDDTFLAYLRKIHSRSHVQWEQQVSFLYDYYGNCLMDFVGRLEDINGLIDCLNSRTNLPPIKKIPHLNNSDSAYNYKKHFCQESREIVEDLYKEDIDILGYSFD